MRSRILHAIPVIVVLLPLSAVAQIVTDGTVGPRATLSGPTLTIGAELGTTRGGNLFHSFQDFNIQAGETATFTGPAQIRNVIGRVTGGNASSIDGTLRSTVGQADVYLINPSGVVLGPNARVDVPASLHVSTADELRFADGARFSAREPAASTLTMAAPESFGFLAPRPAGLTITGSQLAVRPGKTLGLSAGDVTIAGSSAAAPASLIVAGGGIEIAAAGRLVLEHAILGGHGPATSHLRLQADEATLSDALLMLSHDGDELQGTVGGIDLTVAGTLDLAESSSIWARTTAAGTSGAVSIQAGTLRLSGMGTAIETSAEPDSTGNAGAIDIAVTETATLGEWTWITSETQGSGAAGPVRVRAGSLALAGAQIGSESWPGASGAAGSVWITTNRLSLDDNAWISGVAHPGSTGQAAAIRIEVADTARLAGQSWIFSDTFGSGDAGGIALTADRLDVLEGAVISSSTGGTGRGGLVDARAGSLRIAGDPEQALGGLSSHAYSGSSGAAGEVRVEVAGLLEILASGGITSGTYGAGDAGSVWIRAGELRMDGPTDPAVWGSTIETVAYPDASGSPGQVTIEVAGSAALRNGSWILSETYSLAGQDPGHVSINARCLSLDSTTAERPAIIGTDTHAGGPAGTVTLMIADRLDLARNAHVSSTTDSAGDAGTIRILAGAVGIGADSGILAAAMPGATGGAGTISIQADALTLNDGGYVSITSAQALADPSVAPPGSDAAIRIVASQLGVDGGLITASSIGQVPASAIDIQADDLRLAHQGRITTEASAADAGPVTIAGGTLRIDDSLITTSAGTAGHGGDIRLNAQQLILDGGFIQANTAASGARGGDIRIDTQALITSQGQVEIGGAARQDFGSTPGGRNVIQAAAPGGESGTITVTAPAFDISASISPLRAPFADPDDLLADACRAAVGARPSRLVAGGADRPPGDAAGAGIAWDAGRLRRLRADESAPGDSRTSMGMSNRIQ